MKRSPSKIDKLENNDFYKELNSKRKFLINYDKDIANRMFGYRLGFEKANMKQPNVKS